MSESLIAAIVIVVSAFFWSTAGTTTKLLFRFADPYPVAFLRFLIASVIILPFFLVRGIPPRREIIKHILPVMVFPVLNILFFYLGLQRTTADASIIIYSTAPLFVAVFARLFLKEKYPVRKITGLIIGFLGVIIVIVLPLVNRSAVFIGDTLGNIITLFGVIAWAFYAVGSKKLSEKYSPVTISAFSIFASCSVFLILTLLFPHRNLMPAVTNPQFILLISYLAVFVTILTFMFYQWSIKHTTATIASFNNYAQPVFGVIVNGIFLAEKLTWAMAIGAVLTIGGVIIATTAKPRSGK
jgi:drug/metabolite transporter (DMT)-like permease